MQDPFLPDTNLKIPVNLAIQKNLMDTIRKYIQKLAAHQEVCQYLFLQTESLIRWDHQGQDNIKEGDLIIIFSERFQQKEYVKRVDEWLEQSRLWMYERQISYQLIRLSDAFENSLRDFLKVRKLLIR